MSAAPERRPLRSVETPVGVLELLDGGIIFWRVAFEAVVDERLVQLVADAMTELAGGELYATVTDARDLGFADRAAREMAGRMEMEGRVATSVIVSGRVVRWILNQIIRIATGRPIRLFDSEAEAIAWATEQVRLARRS